MGLSDDEERLWNQIMGPFASEGLLKGSDLPDGAVRPVSPAPIGVAQAPPPLDLEPSPKKWEWWRIALGVGVTGVAITLGVNLFSWLQDREEKQLVHQGVELALTNPDALRIIGACSQTLIERAEEVDHILQSDNQAARFEYGVGPTGTELRQAASLADQAKIPCKPTQDGTYTFTLEGRSVNIQLNDVLWEAPSIN